MKKWTVPGLIFILLVIGFSVGFSQGVVVALAILVLIFIWQIVEERWL